MPWNIVEDGDQFCVHKEGGERLKCYDNEAAAKEYMAALYASESKAVEKTIMRYSQEEAGFMPLTATGGQACANCRWFAGAAEGGPFCNIIENYPLNVESNSWCAQWTTLPTPPEEMEAPEPMGQGMDMEMRAADGWTSEFETHDHADVPEKVLYAAPDSHEPHILKALIEKFKRGLKPGQAMLKATDGKRLMLIVTSNSYQDREGETLTTDALKEDVNRHWTQGDDAFMSNNKLLYWHDDAIPLGDIIWGDIIGPFYVEVAKEGDTPIAARYFDYREAHPDEKWGASHRFAYFSQHRSEGGDYRRIYKQETTALPIEAAANLLTMSEVLPMSDKRAKKFNDIMGLDGAYELLKTEGFDALKKRLAEQGIEHKAMGDCMDEQMSKLMDDGMDKEEAMKKARGMCEEAQKKSLSDDAFTLNADAVSIMAKSFVQTIEDMGELDSAITLAVEQMTASKKAYDDKVTELDAALVEVRAMQEALKAQLDARPRSASRADETVVKDAEIEKSIEDMLLVEHPTFGKYRKSGA